MTGTKWLWLSDPCCLRPLSLGRRRLIRWHCNFIQHPNRPRVFSSVQCSLRSEYRLPDARTETRSLVLRPTSFSGGVYSHRLNKWSQIAQRFMLIPFSTAHTEKLRYWTVQYRYRPIPVSIPVTFWLVSRYTGIRYTSIGGPSTTVGCQINDNLDL